MTIQHQFLTDTIKDETRVWEQLMVGQLKLPAHVLGICHYGFTEMLNNVIDHSASQHVRLTCRQDEHHAALGIEDDGMGVFTKLRQHFGFDSDLHALIELVKGKLTVAPQAHSCEGIFFSSKMFDRFLIESGTLSVLFEPNQCVVRHIAPKQGTHFTMEIANQSTRTAQEVFAQFTDPEEFTFCKTKFFVSLAELEGDLTSRSTAKRMTARFENFVQVELDFDGVQTMAQGFADQLARVWPLAHPQTHLKITRPNAAVRSMLAHVMGRVDLPQPIRPVDVEALHLSRI
jgi:anti-sigma regulatory factor (Ser/Thr protein kinase)